MTSSADPYIGDESTTVPPRSKKVLSTSARPSRRRRLLPTLKVIHVPIPITGIRSAVPGIARSMAGPDIAGPGIAGPSITGPGITGTVLGRMSARAGVMPSESPAPVAAVAARNMRRSNGCLKAVG
jgi:hypothetical protein